jgi:hypothetical protein
MRRVYGRRAATRPWPTLPPQSECRRGCRPASPDTRFEQVPRHRVRRLPVRIQRADWIRFAQHGAQGQIQIRQAPAAGGIPPLVHVDCQPAANRVGGPLCVALRVQRISEAAVHVRHAELCLDILRNGGAQRAIDLERLAARCDSVGGTFNPEIADGQASERERKRAPQGHWPDSRKIADAGSAPPLDSRRTLSRHRAAAPRRRRSSARRRRSHAGRRRCRGPKRSAPPSTPPDR